MIDYEVTAPTPIMENDPLVRASLESEAARGIRSHSSDCRATHQLLRADPQSPLPSPLANLRKQLQLAENDHELEANQDVAGFHDNLS